MTLKACGQTRPGSTYGRDAFAGAIPNLRHVKWFADPARLKPVLVDGAPEVRDGALRPRADMLGQGMRLSSAADERLVR